MKSIILIDDDPIIAFTLRQMIKIKGLEAEITHFVRPQMALDHLVDNTPSLANSLILLDLNMPQLDGWQFLSALYKSLPNLDVKTVMISSTVSPDEIEEIERHPKINRFVNKPFTIDTIEELLAF